MTPSIRLHGDKVEAAKWVRRGRAELQRLIGIAENAGVPITNRRIEFNDYVTCNVSKWDGVYVIDITATKRLPEGEEEEEDVVEEAQEFCIPGFIVFRDFYGYYWDEDKEGGPGWSPKQDTGELLVPKGDGSKSWKKVETQYKSGGTVAWYGLKDIIHTLNNKGRYNRCDLVSWNCAPHASMGWMSGRSATGTLYFQGQGFAATADGVIHGACIMPGTGSDKGTDYFYVLYSSQFFYDSLIINLWRPRDMVLKRAPVKFPGEGNTLSWETIKIWEEYDEVNPANEWTNAITPGYTGATCSSPCLSAYIDKNGIAHFTVSAWMQTDLRDDGDHPGETHATNGIPTYSSGALTIKNWGDLYRTNSQFRPTCMRVAMDMRTGNMNNIIDEGRKAAYRETENASFVWVNQPILGIGASQTAHTYCGFEGEGRARSDIWNDALPDDQKRIKWDKQGHQERGAPHIEYQVQHNWGPATSMFGIAGGMDALYEYYYTMTAGEYTANGEGTSERQRWTVVSENPIAYDALPIWEWHTGKTGTYNSQTIDFVVKKNGGEHFKLRMHECQAETSGENGTYCVWKPQPSPFARAEGPFSLGQVDSEKTVYSYSNTATSFAVQRSILYYHPMINKALYLERQTNATKAAGGSTVGTGNAWLKWGNADEYEVLGQWTGIVSSDAGAEGFPATMSGDSWYWTGFLNHELMHCNGESNAGPTIISTHDTLNIYRGCWSQERISGTGTGYKPYWVDLAYGSPLVNGIGINPIPPHYVRRPNGSDGVVDTTYDRRCVAVHHESLSSNKEPAYILYLPKLRYIGTVEKLLGSGWDNVEVIASTIWEFNTNWDENDPDYWFFSNCMTFEEMKRAAGRDTDYPLDFGVV